MQTPRLCIDGRASKDCATHGLVAQELIDQLVAAQGDENISNAWMEKKWTVLLSHPKQLFAGQLKRFETRHKLGGSWWKRAWEKNFVNQAHITSLHRFSRLDQIHVAHAVPTITTVLPPLRHLPTRVVFGSRDTFLVPSKVDRQFFCEGLAVPQEQVFSVVPTVRRYTRFGYELQTKGQKDILVMMGRSRTMKTKKLVQVLQGRFPQKKIRVLPLNENPGRVVADWMGILEKTALCFYAEESPCDWPVLALEALYFNVPVVFPDRHAALSECISGNILRLSHFLIDEPDTRRPTQEAAQAKEQLTAKGCFEPFELARQHRPFYEKCLEQ